MPGDAALVFLQQITHTPASLGSTPAPPYHCLQPVSRNERSCLDGPVLPDQACSHPLRLGLVNVQALGGWQAYVKAMVAFPFSPSCAHLACSMSWWEHGQVWHRLGVPLLRMAEEISYKFPLP